MAFVDFASASVTRPTTAGTQSAGIFHRVAGWVARSLAERERQRVFRDLLFAPEHRLRDLGINRDDILTALSRHR